jgi:PAS domain S-box-containing protein
MAESSKPKILIADDHEPSRLAIKAVLDPLSAITVEASSGGEALDRLLAHSIDVAILDVRMPDMDGFELAETMRRSSRTRAIPIIFVTGAQEPGREFKGYEVGAVDYLIKPVDPLVLRSKVGVFLELSASRRELADRVQALETSLRAERAAREAARQAEEARRRSEEVARERLSELEALYETAPIGLCVFDENLRWVRVNQRIAEMNGRAIEEHIGKTPSQLIADVGAQAEEALRTILRTGDRLDFEMTGTTAAQPNVERAWSEHWVPIKDSIGRVIGISVATEEITERKRTEAALQRALEAVKVEQSRLEAVLEALPVGIVIADNTGRVTHTNAALTKIWGVPPAMDSVSAYAAWRGRWVSNGERLTAEDWALARVLRTREALPGAQLIEIERFGDGRTRTISDIAAPIRDVHGQLIGGVAAVVDVSEQRQSEELLRTAMAEARRANEQLLDADRRKNEFLAILSHELRNPLAPIRNSVYILERAIPGGEQANRARLVIDRQAQHMARLVDDLLDITRISRGKITLQRERVELAALVRRTAEDHREVYRRNGIQFDVRGPDQPIWVDGDPTRLAQIVGNLLSNAAKFTPRGGMTVLSVETSSASALIRVRDDGLGMSAATIRHIFEPFVQAAQTIERTRGGLGLGLALVKGLVEMHGGSVTASSDGEGKGSEFVISLPAQLSDRAAAAASSSKAEGPQSRRVLIVEDNVDAAETLKEALELEQHDVAVAYTGNEGLAKARDLKPEVILCDIGLPLMDGYDVARAIRADSEVAGTFLVALSGYALPEDVSRSLDAGFDRHIAKPPSMDVLSKVIAEAAGRAS